jgi:hypothetical protein
MVPFILPAKTEGGTDESMSLKKLLDLFDSDMLQLSEFERAGVAAARQSLRRSGGLRDRLSLMRFLGIGIADAVAGAKTLWLDRGALAKASAVEDLFDLFDACLSGCLTFSGFPI